MVEGIDVSKYQGTVNWLEVKNSGKEFAVARSSIGMRTIDETFVTNYTRMRNRGLIPGAYHLVVGDATGPEQAANWKAQLDAAGFDKGLLVLDVEGWSATTGGLEDGTLKATEYLCQWVRDNYDRTPIIYTGVYWRENLKQHPNNFGSKLWLSYYGSNPVQNYVPSAWKTWEIWQYSSTGTVPGVNGDCDLNRSAGTRRDLEVLAGEETYTMAEIQAAVAAEVDRAIAELKKSGSADTTKVINAVNSAAEAGATFTGMKVDEVMTKLAEVLTAVNSIKDSDFEVNWEPVEVLVNELHSHVCHRADLHM